MFSPQFYKQRAPTNSPQLQQAFMVNLRMTSTEMFESVRVEPSPLLLIVVKFLCESEILFRPC